VLCGPQWTMVKAESPNESYGMSVRDGLPHSQPGRTTGLDRDRHFSILLSRYWACVGALGSTCMFPICFPKPQGSWAMRWFYLAVVVAMLAAITVLIAQNDQVVEVAFLQTHVRLPLYYVIASMFGAGVGIGTVMRDLGIRFGIRSE